MSKVYLCSFADTRLCLSALRFYQQAKAMQVFDYIFLYNETNLDKEFRDAMSNQACINGGGGGEPEALATGAGNHRLSYKLYNK